MQTLTCLVGQRTQQRLAGTCEENSLCRRNYTNIDILNLSYVCAWGVTIQKIVFALIIRMLEYGVWVKSVRGVRTLE